MCLYHDTHCHFSKFLFFLSFSLLCFFPIFQQICSSFFQLFHIFPVWFLTFLTQNLPKLHFRWWWVTPPPPRPPCAPWASARRPAGTRPRGWGCHASKGWRNGCRALELDFLGDILVDFSDVSWDSWWFLVMFMDLCSYFFGDVCWSFCWCLVISSPVRWGLLRFFVDFCSMCCWILLGYFASDLFWFCRESIWYHSLS